MTLRDCEGVNEEHTGPQEVPRKRIVTEAMKASSRANGAKSKGPITDAGRAKVRFNAIQHGATCKEITFLPGEDEPAFWAKVDQIVEEEGAEGELEIEAIKTAAYSRVTKLRAINAHAIAVTQNMAEIKDHFDDQKRAEVHDLIPKVVKLPDVAVTKLMNSTRGCSFLIREFTSIEARLVTHRSFEISQRAYCLQLAGHRPDELFTDPVVRDLNRSYLGSLRGPGGFTIDMAANALMYDRPEGIKETEYTRRMEPFVRDLVSVEQGHAELKKFVHDRIERLKERKELMGYREERELNAASSCRAVALRWRRGEEAAPHQPERSYLHHGRSPAAGAEAGAAEIRGRGAGRNQSPHYPGPKPRSRVSQNGVRRRGNGPPAGCDSGRQRAKSERTADDASR